MHTPAVCRSRLFSTRKVDVCRMHDNEPSSLVATKELRAQRCAAHDAPRFHRRPSRAGLAEGVVQPALALTMLACSLSLLFLASSLRSLTVCMHSTAPPCLLRHLQLLLASSFYALARRLFQHRLAQRALGADKRVQPAEGRLLALEPVRRSRGVVWELRQHAFHREAEQRGEGGDAMLLCGVGQLAESRDSTLRPQLDAAQRNLQSRG